MKNILILTVDCWNLNIGANSSYTYSNLFSSMDEYSISNIYIREELPNDPCCSRYFQISENRIIKSLFNRKIKTGREVECGSFETQKDVINITKQKEFYNKQRKRLYFAKKMVRELIWFLSSWKSKELNSFLEDIKPDIVIFSMEGYIHFNRICRYVLKKTKAKGIGYFWDDNFTYKQRPGNFGYLFLRFFQRISLKKLSRKSTAFWAISPKTKSEADEFFGIDCRLLSKPTERDIKGDFNDTYNYKKPIKMLYAGNLMIGRENTIKMLAKALADINRDEIKISLDVYTQTEVCEELEKIGNGVTFHAPVSQSEILNIQQQSDILLFAEDVAGKERKVARLSFSTKIPDYMSCGKCILAIGDYDTAPMEYFLQEDIALCASNEEELKNQLEKILAKPTIMSECGKRAYESAKKNHSKNEIQCMVRKTIDEVLLQ